MSLSVSDGNFNLVHQLECYRAQGSLSAALFPYSVFQFLWIHKEQGDKKVNSRKCFVLSWSLEWQRLAHSECLLTRPCKKIPSEMQVAPRLGVGRQLTNWSTERATDRPTETDWLTDWLTDWRTDGRTDGRTNPSTNPPVRSSDRLTGFDGHQTSF